ncbi:MAG TPA: hypothetical protein VMI11_02640 [Actinomycetes bacterium]|nr:hypothetical protein [Actinomycetes bacterium]
MSVPPGWPREVEPPESDGFVESAAAWLLDQAPPEFRAHEILRRHPVVLARFTAHHVAGALGAARDGYRSARTELRDVVSPEVVAEALQAWEAEGARLLALSRAVDLVEQALRGKRFVPRL